MSKPARQKYSRKQRALEAVLSAAKLVVQSSLFDLSPKLKDLKAVVAYAESCADAAKAPTKPEDIPDFEWPCCPKCGEPVQVYAEDFHEWYTSCSALPDHTGYAKGSDPISALRNFALKNTPPEKDEE